MDIGPNGFLKKKSGFFFPYFHIAPIRDLPLLVALKFDRTVTYMNHQSRFYCIVSVC